MFGGGECTFNCKYICLFTCYTSDHKGRSTYKGVATKFLQRASVDCLFADWQYCLIVFITWFFYFHFCFFVSSSKYFFIRMHMFYYDLSCLVLAGDRQLWSCYGSAFLDQLEVNEGCFLRMNWEGDWLQAAKIAFTTHKIFWKENKITLAADGMCKGLCTSVAELKPCADPATATCNLIFPGSLLPFSMWMAESSPAGWALLSLLPFHVREQPPICLGVILNFPGQGPGQSDVILKLTLLWWGRWNIDQHKCYPS